jgi:hypothetical protein
MARGKVYSYSYDKQQANKINAYIKANPNATRKLIRSDCITNHHRLQYLEQQGLITLPPPTPRGERNKEYYHG